MRVVVVGLIILPLLIGSTTGLSVVSPANSGFAFHSAFVDQGPSPTLAPGTTANYSVRFRNLGPAAWIRGTASQVNLGVQGDSTEFAESGIAVGWRSSTRLATSAEEFVLPGLVATFTFTVRAPTTAGVYRVPLRLVADGITWLEDEHVVLKITSDLGFHGQLLGQSGHPTLKPGEVSQPMTVTIRNTGAKTWVRGVANQQVNLGITDDDKSFGFLNVGWPTTNRVAAQTESIVGPGGLATFTFRVRAPLTPGVYVLRLRPVADGVTWLEDDGLLSLITVVGSGQERVLIPAASSPGSPSFTLRGSVDPAVTVRGSAVAVSGSFLSATSATAIVGFEVYAPDSATLVYQKWFEDQTFAAGETRPFGGTWVVPVGAALGAYSVNLRAYAPGWKTLFSSKPAATSFSVTEEAAATRQSPVSVATGPSGANPTGTVAAPSGAAPQVDLNIASIAAPKRAPTFSTSASVAPASLARGASENASVAVSSPTAVSALVDIEIWAPGSASAVYQVWFDNQMFTPGHERSFPAAWQVPMTAVSGDYVVKVGVFAPGWASLYSWTEDAATFSVVVPTVTPSPVVQPPSATPVVTTTPAPTIAATPSPAPSAATPISVNDTSFTYTGTWFVSTDPTSFAANDHYTTVTGSTFSITFNGTSLGLLTTVAPNHGISAVSLDGGAEIDVDLYAPSRLDQKLVYATPTLPFGTHVVTVRVTGRKNVASTDFYVVADRADIVGTLGPIVTVTPAPTPVPTVVPTPVPAPTPVPTITAPPAPGSFTLIPTDRLTTWNPGIPGGVPARTTVCTNVSASTFGSGSADATAGIQAALDACPVGQVVQLSAGDFKILSVLQIKKGIVLRGMGPAQTKLKMPVGTNSNLITIGTQYLKFTNSTNFTTTAAKGSRTASLASIPAGLAAGEIVLVDQLTNTAITEWCATCPVGDVSRTWFTRPNRPIGQTMEVQSVSGNTVTFTTPFHIAFQTAFNAQLSRFAEEDNGPVVPAATNAGVENLYLSGGSGGQGNIWLSGAGYSWIKNIDSDFQDGISVMLIGTFRSIVRDSYIHHTQTPYPGGGGYGLGVSWYSSDNLIENNIVWNMNKVMVMQASGGGNVIAYNYMEDGWIGNYLGWVEVGLNASHMTTPHYELFEGNESFNFDGDNTWGNAVYITVFRNHMTSMRRSAAPLTLTDTDNRRAVGLMEGHWWYSFVGNVLGYSGMSPAPYSGFTYQTGLPWSDDPVGMWRLGYNPENWNAPADPKVLSTIIREGNFDYATNLVHWSATAQQLPASLYLASKPAFFGANAWPWVDPTGATKVFTLPARARFDAMPVH